MHDTSRLGSNISCVLIPSLFPFDGNHETKEKTELLEGQGF
jgi:hypothetical protein